MVCSVGSRRMAAMARILATGSFSQTAVEEVCHQKLAAQYIQRELREADEANLLDEEDMQVFGLNPMEDPLHLVCCNACKKPVKISQYAAHAELCRWLNSIGETLSEVHGGTGHKKPPRKERKKLLAAHANQATAIGEQGKPEPVDANDTAASRSHLDVQIGTTSSFFVGKKVTAVCVDTAPLMNDSGVSIGNADCLAGVMPPPMKRSKLIAVEGLPTSDVLEAACGVTKNTCISRPEAAINVPAPLATKIYYSQRNHRFRSAIGHLFNEASAKEHCSDLASSKGLQGIMMPSQASSSKELSLEQVDDHVKKKREKYTLPSARDADHVHPQSSEARFCKSGACLPAANCSSQFPVNNVLKHHAAPVGIMRSKYLPKPYSIAGNSGTPLVVMQQSNGSVPVI
ncbi:uncharacterized protein LOC131151944 isoform X3 [Malania oleifera]|uniref:uncharacterized protein LOC131151944 isoform X3 n=1 Tax=Malania oleifera TaxID=397392 RepID=UPI0025ADE62C|nr:uncharacterized protein LOC131151944 isoform X3 [Malania oleifera]XP_057959443.1 uncharacterized protein LOC131151944 isoform X3 [Malania oleifera]XP_057959446.1 uncharacterized protein LOC131151944 isoform X3 [Malania oleifera]